MASGAISFVLNRKSDWFDGSITKNLEFKVESLVLNNKNGENGIYISKAFDSMQDETVWHRMRLNISAPASAVYRLKIYAGDTSEISIAVPGKSGLSKVDINEYINDPSIDINRKLDMFDDIGATRYENFTDILMYHLKGRYLWFCMEFINYEEHQLKINSIKIELPQITFMDYLPEYYRKNSERNSFLERFIGIFQSIYVDLEDEIDYTPTRFDVDLTNKDFLSWICEWLSVKDAAIWGEKRLRKLVKEAIKIYKMKGTKRAIAKIVQEYVGIEPIIVEQFDVKNNMYYDIQKDIVENLFGDNGYIFTVMIPEAYVKDNESYVELLRVINGVKPVDSICNLVVLSDQIYLGHHCYMGINSFITRNEELVLDKTQKDVNNLIISNKGM